MQLKEALRYAALRVLRFAFIRFVNGTVADGHLEVERKFKLSPKDAELITVRLEQLGFSHAGSATMTDCFLPACAAGEMMRVREEQADGKPPVRVLALKKWVKAGTGKERLETERTTNAFIVALWKLSGLLAGGKSLPAFSKRRHSYERTGTDMVITVDDVEGLGPFSGYYMEAEVLVPPDESPDASVQQIYALVHEIFGEPRDPLKQSYKDMLFSLRKPPGKTAPE